VRAHLTKKSFEYSFSNIFLQSSRCDLDETRLVEIEKIADRFSKREDRDIASGTLVTSNRKIGRMLEQGNARSKPASALASEIN